MSATIYEIVGALRVNPTAAGCVYSLARVETDASCTSSHCSVGNYGWIEVDAKGVGRW